MSSTPGRRVAIDLHQNTRSFSMFEQVLAIAVLRQRLGQLRHLLRA